MRAAARRGRARPRAARPAALLARPTSTAARHSSCVIPESTTAGARERTAGTSSPVTVYEAYEPHLRRARCRDVLGGSRRTWSRRRGQFFCDRRRGPLDVESLSSSPARRAEGASCVGARRLQRPEAANAVCARQSRKDRGRPLGRPTPLASARGSHQQDSLGLSCSDAGLRPANQRAADGGRRAAWSARPSAGDRRPRPVGHQSPCSGMLAADSALVPLGRHARSPVYRETVALRCDILEERHGIGRDRRGPAPTRAA
jgi:hypothetical protein